MKSQHARVRALAQQLETTAGLERRHLARELHDELAQLLTALRIDLGWLRRKFSPGQEALVERTHAMSHIVERIQVAVKRIAASLRPKVLDEQGLIPAINELDKEYSGRTGIQCEVRAPEQIVIPDPQITMLYRISQEGLTNIAKHDQADQVQLRIEEAPEHYLLSISDNGKGISESDQRKGNSFGLIGMRERVASINGSFELTSGARGGTTITVRIPKTGMAERRSGSSGRSPPD